jgi:CRP-like cAMP-binding protein
MIGYGIEDSPFQCNWDSVTDLCSADPQFRRIVSVRRIHEERMLASADKPLQHTVIVLDGRLHVEAFESGIEEGKTERRKLFALPFEDGTVLGPSLFSDWSAYNVKAVTPTIVCYLLADLEYLGQNWSDVLEALLRSQISVQQQMYDEQLEAYEPVRTRLARLLMRESFSGQASISMSHKAIAERLGTYRETVSNQLARLKNAGVIDYGYRVIEVRDAERLNLMTFTCEPMQ